MNSEHEVFRLAATGVIWFVVMGVVGSAIWAPVAGSPVNASELTGVIFIIALAAATSTWAIWSRDEKRVALPTEMLGKSKRDQHDPRERLMKTLSALDDHEAAAMLDDLRSRLHGGDSDGEISALDTLREERRPRAK